MVGDYSGELGAFLFLHASQISVMVGNRSCQMKTKICTVRDVSDGFCLLPISKFLGSSPPITDKHGVSETDFWQLSDTSAKSGTFCKKLNPRSPRIFQTYENQAWMKKLCKCKTMVFNFLSDCGVIEDLICGLVDVIINVPIRYK